MDTIKVESGKTQMIAHRGVSGIECENTNAAFVAAGNRSYAGIETDVHVTADGRYVIFHDDNTQRVSGVDAVVEKSTYKELAAIRLYDKEPGTTRTDLRIPELEEYIRICKRYEKIAVLELKNAMTPYHVMQIVEVVKKAGYLEQTIFISFAWDNLACIKENLPEQRVQFLTSEECSEELIERLKQWKMDLDIYYLRANKELIEKLHANGILVNCWTVDTKESAEELISWGVDYLTSNILE